MRVIRLDAAARDLFLADTRLGILGLNRPSGVPVGVPLWYGWDGERASMFSERRSAKVRWIERDPRATLLVTNVAPERPRWVSIDGRAAIHPERGQDEARRLVSRYLIPISEQEHGSMLRSLGALDLVQIVLEPGDIRSYAEVG